MNGRKYDTLPIPPPDYTGFIADVDRQLKRFYHDDKRSVSTCYILAIFLGMFGAHHFYLGRKVVGYMYFFTLGLFGIGYIIDLFRIRFLVKAANLRKEGDGDEKSLFDVYLLWFPCGLLGFHYFYLDQYLMGVLYLLTGGVYGIGWIVDVIRLPQMVSIYNEKSENTKEISLLHAYLFAIPPFGFIGAHQFYCRRTYWGIFYTCTLGAFGVGWVFDFIRMPFLVSRVEKMTSEQRHKIYKDDVYLLWLSCGIVGVHHLYLKRYKWAIIYLFTLGLFGFGWLSDIFRIPRLVKEYNDEQCKSEDATHVIELSKKKEKSSIAIITGNDVDGMFDNIANAPSPRAFVITTAADTEIQSATFPRVGRSQTQRRSRRKSPNVADDEPSVRKARNHKTFTNEDDMMESELVGQHNGQPGVRQLPSRRRLNRMLQNAEAELTSTNRFTANKADLVTSEEDEPKFNIIRRTKSSESNNTHTISLENENVRESRRRRIKRKRSRGTGSESTKTSSQNFQTHEEKHRNHIAEEVENERIPKTENYDVITPRRHDRSSLGNNQCVSVSRNASVRTVTPRDEMKRDFMTDVDVDRTPTIYEGQNIDIEDKSTPQSQTDGPVAKVITVKKSPSNESLKFSHTSGLRRSISRYKKKRRIKPDIGGTGSDLFPGSDPTNGVNYDQHETNWIEKVDHDTAHIAD